MQPKTEAKTKQNLEAPRENKKEVLNAQEVRPIDQWDAVAFRLIRQELAPKGYSEIKRGPWRGKVQSNIPFLPKRSVERCQQIAAQMVRMYRANAVNNLKAQVDAGNKAVHNLEDERKRCPFWRFGRRRDLNDEIMHHMAATSALNHWLHNLESIPVK